METHRNPCSSDIFDLIEAVFPASPEFSATLLGPGGIPDELPSSAITTSEARDLLMTRDTSRVVSDMIWAAVIRNVRGQNGWQQTAIWMMLSSLRKITHKLRCTWRVDPEEIRSEVLVGFLETLHVANPDGARLWSFLWWSTYRRARAACQQWVRELATGDIDRIASKTRIGREETASPFDPTPSPLAPTEADARVLRGERLGSVAQRWGPRQPRWDRQCPRDGGKVVPMRYSRRRRVVSIPRCSRGRGTRGGTRGYGTGHQYGGDAA